MGKKYHDDGLQLLFFPCNQFCSEEPGSAEDIAAFYVGKHSLPKEWLMERADVNGANTQPVYAFLKNTLPGDIDWNFTKFVVSRNGKVVARYPQSCKPDVLEKRLTAEWLEGAE